MKDLAKGLSSKHKKTFDEVKSKPTKSGIEWRKIEGLLVALGAEIKEGNGSAVSVEIGDEYAVFHRPHPRKEANKGAVKAVRDLLELLEKKG